MISSLLDHNKVQVNEKQELRKNVVGCQASVIELQKQLLEAKDEQLKTIQSAVKETVSEVKSDVKAEFKSYSAVLQTQSGSCGVTITPAEVKTAVKTALADWADEEGREGNVDIFGLKEEANENVNQKSVKFSPN